MLAASAAVPLLVAVAWTAGCQREGATDPTAAGPATAAARLSPARPKGRLGGLPRRSGLRRRRPARLRSRRPHRRSVWLR